jgi:hypothetical protein
MNYSLRAREECNLLAEAMEKEYGIKEVTSDTQYKHGTRTFQISTGEKFGVYKSGMVRKIIKTKLLNDYSCYQLNKQYQQNSRAMFLNNDGTFEVKNYTGTARIPIYTEFARLNYLLGYLKRNYGVIKKSPEFVMINGVKYIRDDKH